MKKNALAEIFGFKPDDFSEDAKRYRKLRLCPFNNIVPNCTKDKAQDPLGVCSMFDGNGDMAIICPVRFRENWVIAENAASFFFPSNIHWTSLTEVRLKDKNGVSAGNVDVVLVSYDKEGDLIDFGVVEIQAVYVSGNIRNVYKNYISHQDKPILASWVNQVGPRPDYLSSSRKRLAPQLLYKGGIFRAWNKKMAVAVHSTFFNTLPKLPVVDKDKADVAWLIYNLTSNGTTHSYKLTLTKTVYTRFDTVLNKITQAEPGPESDFRKYLQSKLDEKLSVTPPTNNIIGEQLTEQ